MAGFPFAGGLFIGAPGTGSSPTVSECANALVTLAVVKAELNITNIDSDEQLVRWQCWVSKAIRDYCNSYITTLQNSVEFPGNGGPIYTLPGKPVQPSAGGTMLEYESGFNTFIEIPQDNNWRIRRKGTTNRYELYYGGALYNQSSYGDGYGGGSGFLSGVNYRVTYTTGYTTIPAPVQEVAVSMFKVLYKESFTDQQNSRFGISQLAKGAMGMTDTTVFKDMRPEWKEKLAPYKTVSWGVG